MAAPTTPIVPRPDRLERERWFECARKRVVYYSRGRAEAAAERLTREDARAGREARPWNAYHCRFCGSYHVGHERRVEPCGICDVPHRCHCWRLRSHCDDCLPLGAER